MSSLSPDSQPPRLVTQPLCQKILSVYAVDYQTPFISMERLQSKRLSTNICITSNRQDDSAASLGSRAWIPSPTLYSSSHRMVGSCSKDILQAFYHRRWFSRWPTKSRSHENLRPRRPSKSVYCNVKRSRHGELDPYSRDTLCSLQTMGANIGLGCCKSSLPSRLELGFLTVRQTRRSEQRSEICSVLGID